MRTDLYQSVTNQIVEQPEQGVRPWMKPWDADHLGARAHRSQRHNGITSQSDGVEPGPGRARLTGSPAKNDRYGPPLPLGGLDAIKRIAAAR